MTTRCTFLALLCPALFRFVAVASMMAFFAPFSSAQSETLDAQTREAVVNRVGELLEEFYVFPKVAQQCKEYLQAQLAAGAFDKVVSPLAFAESLTKTLRSISHDKHMLVRVRPPARAQMQRDDPEAARLRRLDEMRRRNFGFERVEHLDGNIGYIDMRSFARADLGRETAAAAMAFVANCDAIIFDLRKNGGGFPNMVQFICSYFFGERTHLNSLYWREGDRTQEFWTLDEIPGKRMPDVPLFVLTSYRTFSGAEEFTYNLRTRRRATIIGETTGGGANPGRFVNIDERFGMVIPTGKAINPVTGTNWEGVGVKPHIAVSAGAALERALTEARVAAKAYAEAKVERHLALKRSLAKDRDVVVKESKRDPYFTPTAAKSTSYMPRVITRSILQDRAGDIWFATFGGPIRYDGNNFRNFSEEVGLAKTRVFSMVEDRKGALWFGSITGGASRYDGKSYKKFTVNEGLASNDIYWIFEDRDANIWFGTPKGVSRYDGNSMITFTTKEGLVHDSVYAITQDKTGRIWFGTQGGVCSYDGKSFSNLAEKVGRSFVNVRAMVVDRSGKLWFGGQEGAFCYDGKTLSAFTSKNGLLSDFVGSLIVDRKGNLWMGHPGQFPSSHGGGATRYDGKSFKHFARDDGMSLQRFTLRDGLSITDVYCMFEDKAGNIWFGSAGDGVCRFDGKTFSSFPEATSRAK
ncbi:MAG: two-component regulator propeller domain-containing protein [Planctomycetota bacterium]